jgi:hypothetical protein
MGPELLSRARAALHANGIAFPIVIKGILVWPILFFALNFQFFVPVTFHTDRIFRPELFVFLLKIHRIYIQPDIANIEKSLL